MTDRPPRRPRRRGAILASGVLGAGAALAIASAAWACVPQPYLVVQPRASGPAGAEVDVVGDTFDPGPTEVRWNGIDGELLGKAEGPSFVLTVTIPDDDAGLYSLIAVSRGPQGQVVGVTRTAFSLTGAGGAVDPSGPGGTTDTLDGGGETTAAGEEQEASSPGSVVPMLAGAALAGGGIAAGAGAATFAARRRRPSPRT